MKYVIIDILNLFVLWFVAYFKSLVYINEVATFLYCLRENVRFIRKM